MESRMKAMVFDQYGPPEKMHLEEVDIPTPADNEMLIKVRASSINDWDWALLHGLPFANRIMFGLSKPKIRSLGSDIAGIVEKTGKDVSRFKPGDEVFGDLTGTGNRGWGGFAEYHCAREDAVLLKPKTISFEQAAALPQAAVLAWQGMLKGKVTQGTRILINGASGGTGSFAIQMAKHLGAEVTGTARTEKLEFIRQLGCDHVVDFTKQNFTQTGKKYDVILDLMAHFSIFDYRKALAPDGQYIMVGGVSSKIFQILTLSFFMNLFTRQNFCILMHKANKGLEDVVSLIESGNIEPVIDRCFSLEDTIQAMKYFGEGQKKGKVVISLP